MTLFIPNEAMKLYRARLIYQQGKTLVLGAFLSDCVEDEEIAVRISACSRKSFNRPRMEYLAAHIPGVVPLLGLRLYESGSKFSLRELFASGGEVEIASRHIETHDGQVLVTWSKLMDGDLTTLSLSLRCEKQLRDLFVRVLKTGPKHKYGSYILHNDLYDRNIFFKQGAELDFYLGDFGESVFTDDVELVDHEIEQAVSRLQRV